MVTPAAALMYVVTLFWQEAHESRLRYAVEKGANIPLLQSVQSLVHKKSLNYVKYGNGWVLANSMDWT